MSEINFDEYEFKEFVHSEFDSNDGELLSYLTGILNDRSIPENAKQEIRLQYNEIMRLKSITMLPPKVILERRK